MKETTRVRDLFELPDQVRKGDFVLKLTSWRSSRSCSRGTRRPGASPMLHALREPHPFVGKKKILQLHFHMVGQDSIEAAVFGR